MSPVEGDLPSAQHMAEGKLVSVHHGGFLSTGAAVGAHHWITTCQKVVCDRRLAFLRDLDVISVSRKEGELLFNPNCSSVQNGITMYYLYPHFTPLEVRARTYTQLRCSPSRRSGRACLLQTAWNAVTGVAAESKFAPCSVLPA